MLAVPLVTRGILLHPAMQSITSKQNRGTAPAHGNGDRSRLAINFRGAKMLRVETQELNGALICRLEGRVTGDGAEYVQALVSRCQIAMKLVVDLTEVMYVDAIGENVLLLLKKLGAEFVAENSYSRDVCERLQLPHGSSKYIP
jgi:hypothetical protein